ncbi:CDP-diacylglycerol--glycerol-3-phosphate 3-phosphatidyltransferase [Albimonas sp. CAU 1670]|uniref:CDP-diacylglycerol--glycerol-3-phosphate 3-phosphatidyltransferase n=1 Tax=Albimonas sp. CAU 1670 TaxID=3032599 RepID=UPI0023DC62D1|nr:CDP-diacylglycerol--glycerol-3-phosphate 3-phosphatidyltransferase [Albimonas sp. CAU 1670]MDF2231109.1 CDP-diacylglycerol--glycerol-3-phosphate 3-phosphatidyltransferase [Albimonas sp. CAU 1670]
MPLTVPNLLTLLRLLAAPAVALVYVVAPRPAADAVAVTLFMGASLTDFFDGWLARRWNQQTEFGRMLDPIADKAMVTIALAVLMMLAGVDPWLIIPAAAIFLRETAVSGLREHLAGRVTIPVTRLAKWKTTVQMVAIGALFLEPWGEPMRYAGLALIWLAAALTVVTGWDYFRRGLASSAMRGES